MNKELETLLCGSDEDFDKLLKKLNGKTEDSNK